MMDLPRPPEDPELRNIIDKLAQFVARNGPEFEQMTKNKQAGNAKFMFLFGGEYHAYYLFRVASERGNFHPNQDTFGPRLPPPLPQPPHHHHLQHHQQQHNMPPFFHHQGPPLPPGQSGGPPFNPHFPPPPHPPHPSQPPAMMKHQGSDMPPLYGGRDNSMHLPPPPPIPPISGASQLPLPPSIFQANYPLPHPPQPPIPPMPPATSQNQFGSTWPNFPPPIMTSSESPITPLPSPSLPLPPTHPAVEPHHSSHSTHTADHNNANNNKPHHPLDPNIIKQIEEMREKVTESEKNLALQHEAIMKEKAERIDEMITKSLDDELKRMCEDYDINLNEFDKMLKPIIETCRKESIANGKVWIFSHCESVEHHDAVAKHILKKITRSDLDFEAKLHLMYLLNDLYNHCMRKADDTLRDSLNSIIVPAFATAMLEADDDKKQKMNKLLKLWEMNQYLDNTLLDQLKAPQESLDAYKTSLNERFADQIRKITEDHTERYNKLQQMHDDFATHQEQYIKHLQSPPPPPTPVNQPPFLPPPLPNSGTATPSANLFHGTSPQLPPPPPLAPFVPSGHQAPPIPPGFPPVRFPPAANLLPPPPSSANFFPNHSAATGANPFPLPPPGIGAGSPLNISSSQPPNAPSPLYGASAPIGNAPQPLAEEPLTPYFEMPAGIITAHVKLDDFDYKPIDPKVMRIPQLTPPTEKIIKAMEAFYAAPSHEHPRSADGWEKLGLYEFFKSKSQTRKNMESSNAETNDTANDDSGSQIDLGTSNGVNDGGKRNRTPSPPKRRYREFKEEKESSANKQTTLSSTSSSSSSAKSSAKARSRSRSASISPPPRGDRRRRSRRKSRSKSRSRSRSRSRSPRSSHNRSRSRRSRSRSPAAKQAKFRGKRANRSPSKSPPPPNSASPFQPSFNIVANAQTPLSETNKGHQLLKKMGWSGAGGLGSKEHGIQDPISAGDVRDKVDQYRGIGSINPAANDPFESYRRNKGQAYIQRIKDNRRE